MSRDRLGEIPVSDLDNDFKDTPDIDRKYGSGFVSRLEDKVANRAQKARLKRTGGEEFPIDLLEEVESKDPVDVTKKRMKKKGLTDEELDLAYGRQSIDD